MDFTRAFYISGERVEATVTSKASTIHSWISSVRSPNYGLSREIVVGLDCEWRPNTTATMNNRTTTLQLCVGTGCLIVQLIHLDYIPQALSDFLGASDVVLVGVEVERDAAKIRGEYGLNCRRVVDVRDVAMQKYSFDKKPGLKDLALAIVGINIPKQMDVSMSNWEGSVLDEGQVEYASFDAYASYRIGAKLLKGI